MNKWMLTGTLATRLQVSRGVLLFLFFHVPGCSGMFRHVPECSVFRVLSTAHKLYSTNPCFYPPRGFPTRLKYLFYLSRTKTLCLLSNSLRSCVLPIIPLCPSRAKEAKKKLRLISGYPSNVCGCKNLIVLTQLPFIIS